MYILVHIPTSERWNNFRPTPKCWAYVTKEEAETELQRLKQLKIYKVFLVEAPVSQEIPIIHSCRQAVHYEENYYRPIIDCQEDYKDFVDYCDTIVGVGFSRNSQEEAKAGSIVQRDWYHSKKKRLSDKLEKKYGNK